MAARIQRFPCNTCTRNFTTSAAQREHMRSEWHVSNLRRRIAGDKALSEEEWDKAQTKAVPRLKRQSPSPPVEEMEELEEVEDEYEEDSISPTQCLFCPTFLSSIEENVNHMSSTHGLFMPNRHLLSDMESFLGYLSTIVFECHECLFCGIVKGSLEGVRTHMKDKGHCKIKMEDVREFCEYDTAEEEKIWGVNMGDNEWRLPSGVIITSGSDTTPMARRAKTRNRSSRQRLRKAENHAAITATAEQQDLLQTSSTNRQLTTMPRNANLSLAGLEASQIRALQRTEKSMRSREASAKTAGRHAMEQAPVLTKYYKTENPVYQAG
jgi:pre-60S factor REI1